MKKAFRQQAPLSPGMQKHFNRYLVITTCLSMVFWLSGGFWAAAGMFLVMWGVFGIVAGIVKRHSKRDLRTAVAVIGVMLFFAGGTILPETDTSNAVLGEETTRVDTARDIETKVTPKAYPVSDSGLKLYKVTSIIDGDTIKVSIDGKVETIRLIGIDTPETKDPGKPVQCYGAEASSKMQSLVQSKSVALEADATQGDRDTYGRLLRYVFLEDGGNVGLELIKSGFAHEYTYDKSYKYQAEFREAQRVARESGAGFWAPATCGGNTRQTADAARASTPPDPGPTPAPRAAAPAAPVHRPAPAPQPAPAPVSAPAPAPQGNCDPNYTPCIPIVSYDLDCSDIGVRVTVIGVDHHNLDHGGIPNVGCESY